MATTTVYTTGRIKLRRIIVFSYREYRVRSGKPNFDLVQDVKPQNY